MNDTWKPHTKKPMVSSQNPWVPNASWSASFALCAAAAPTAPEFAPRCSRKPNARTTINADSAVSTNIVVCQLSKRFWRIEASGTMANCPNEPPAVATPSATERRSGGVCRAIAPKIGPNPAAAMPMPESTLPSVSITPSLASAIISIPAT